MFETYTPGFSNELFRSQLLKSDAGLTGGGPAYVDIMPGQALPYDGEPMDQPAMVPGAQAAQPPSILPSPSAPPMMSAPTSYVPGFSPMLLNQATPERVSMLPFAPEAPAPAPAPAPAAADPTLGGLIDPAFLARLSGTALGNLGTNPIFIGTGLGGMPTQQSLNLLTDPATGLMVNKSRTVELDDTGRVVREITPEGSVPGVYFTNDQGIAATAGLGKGARFTPLNPNAVYTVINQRTGEVVSTGTGAEGMKAAQLATIQLNKAGRKSDWAVVEANPAANTSRAVANVDPRPSDFGQFADVALPLAGAFLVPGLGLVGSKVLGAGLGAAAGSGISSVAQGRSLGDTLLRAGLSGAGAAGGAALGKGLGTALSKVGGTAGQTVGQTVGNVVIDAAGNMILPVAARSAGSALGSALGTAAGGALSNFANMAPGKGTDFADRMFEQPSTPAVQPSSPLDTVSGDPITVLSNRVPAGGALPFAAAGASALAQPGVDAAINSIKQQIEQKQAEQEPENEIVVRPKEPLPIGALLGPAVLPDLTKTPVDVPNPADANVGTLNIPENEIVVTASGKAPTSFDKQPAPPLAPTLPDLTKTPVDVQGPKDNRFTLEDIYKYLRAAGLLSSLVGGGGGRRGGAGTVPSGFGFSPVFSGSLPRATLPGASTGFAPRPQTSRDYYRYGYGPSQSFFSYVPEGERNLSQAYTGYAHGGMAEGGDTFAVNGPGTGRSDEIPAMLSDGEYVMDAETVALLGDGSSKAGAERLDQFRINVRRDKGRKLAKGEFSVDAKRPEHYLKGGRA